MNNEMLIINFELTLNVIYIEKTLYQGLIKCNAFCLKVSNIKFVLENMFILILY